jgi:hypothetical protein
MGTTIVDWGNLSIIVIMNFALQNVDNIFIFSDKMSSNMSVWRINIREVLKTEHFLTLFNAGLTFRHDLAYRL